MNGLGKPRSDFGEFMDRNKIKQKTLVKDSGVSKSTISKACIDNDFSPSYTNGVKIIKCLQSQGYEVGFEDFWN